MPDVPELLGKLQLGEITLQEAFQKATQSKILKELLQAVWENGSAFDKKDLSTIQEEAKKHNIKLYQHGGKELQNSYEFTGIDEIAEENKHNNFFREKVVPTLDKENIAIYQGQRGDGNCFYRSFGVGYVNNLLVYDQNESLEEFIADYQKQYNYIIENIKDKDIHKDITVLTPEKFREKMEMIRDGGKEKLQLLHQELNSAEKSHQFDRSIIAYIRSKLAQSIDIMIQSGSSITLGGQPIEWGLDGFDIDENNREEALENYRKIINTLGRDFEGQFGHNILGHIFGIDINSFFVDSNANPPTVNIQNASHNDPEKNFSAIDEIKMKKPPVIGKLDFYLPKGHYESLYDTKFYNKAVEQELTFPGVVPSPYTKVDMYIDEIIKMEEIVGSNINAEKRRSEIKGALLKVGNQEDKRVEYLIGLIKGPESLIHKELGSDIQVSPELQKLLNEGARYNIITDIKDSVLNNLQQNYHFQNTENPDINVATIGKAITHALEAFVTNIDDLKGEKRNKLEQELTDVIYSMSSYTWKGLATGGTYMKEGRVYDVAEKIANVVENHVFSSDKTVTHSQKELQASTFFQKNSPQEAQPSVKHDKNLVRSSTFTEKHVPKSASFVGKEKERSKSVDYIYK